MSSATSDGRRNIVRNFQTEVAGTFSEIWVIWRRKSHALDLQRVGRYTLWQH